MKSIEYKYSDHYIIVNFYLIPKSKSEKLKPLLRWTTFRYARLILSQNDIPSSYHDGLISKLGFCVKPMNNYFRRQSPPDPNCDNSGLIVVQKDIVKDKGPEELRDIILHYISTGRLYTLKNKQN